MSLRTGNVGLDGLAPRKYTEVRTVYDTNVSYVCFYQEDSKFISGIELRTYADGNDKLTRIFITMPSAVQTLLDAQSWV